MVERIPDRIWACALVVPFLIGFSMGPDRGGRVEFTFGDPAIVESSGLVALKGRFFTVNDSGDSARVFVVDPGSGRTVRTLTWGEGDPEDVEALAPYGEDAVLVGDIGDNTASRASVSIAVVPVVPDAGEATSYSLVYPDEASDAETLMVHPVTQQVLVVTKGIFGGTLYAAPPRLVAGRPNRLAIMGDLLPIATDGAFFPSGDHFVVRDYSRAVVYTYPGLETVGSFDLPQQEQGEGIAVDAQGDVFVSTEGQFSDVLAVEVPAEIRREVSPAPDPTPGPAPNTPAATEDQDSGSASTPVWPWLLTGVAATGLVVVLLRSLRPR